MPRYIAFLRAINVGNGRTVKMETLRQLFHSLGFSQVATFIASGNVIFETTAQNTRTLEDKIERKMLEGLGYPVATFVRTDVQVAEIAEFQPFQPSAIGAAAQFNVIFLLDPLDDKSRQKLMAFKTDTDEFRVHKREIYWLRRRGPNGALYSTVPLDTVLQRPFTIRGAKTIKRLAAKYSPI